MTQFNRFTLTVTTDGLSVQETQDLFGSYVATLFTKPQLRNHTIYWESETQATCRECGEDVNERHLSGLGYCAQCEQDLDNYEPTE